MKNKMLMSLLGLSCMGIAFANTSKSVCEAHFGSVVCGSGTVENVKALGEVSLNGTTITHLLAVTGNVSAKNAHVGRVNCMGNLTLSNSQFKQHFSVIGNVKASDSQFLGDLEITGPNTFFTRSKMRNITIRKAEHADEKVYLKGGTVVSGDVVFESGQGFVIASGGSSVSGQVIGGRLITE